jgi:hypothetical protein
LSWRLAVFLLAIGVLANPAQARAPSAARAYFSVVLPPAPLCANQAYPVLVTVLPGSKPTAEAIKSKAEAPRGLAAIGVDALVRDAGIAFINPNRAVSGLADMDELDSQPGVMHFRLYTKAAGTTEVYFEALVKGSYVEATVPLTVEQCEVEVTALSTWHVPGEAHLALAASIHRGPMNADESGRLTGIAEVKWFVVSTSVEDCSEQPTLVTTSRADLIGQLAEDGGITVNVVYEAVPVSLSALCANAEGSIAGSQTVIVTPQSLNLQAPASGTTVLLSQILDGPEATPGEVAVAVRPVTK